MPRTLKLAVVGTAAGPFSGLFGVGGGIVRRAGPRRWGQMIRRALRAGEATEGG
jgi:hypothetical protein